jgi:hypothetical protein
VVLVLAGVMWALTRGAAKGDPTLEALLLTAVVAVPAAGLSGQDLALDRTAAIRWVPRRAAHVLLIAAVAGAVLLLSRATGGVPLEAGIVLRNSAGLAGLAAAAATVFGGRFAWTVPFGWSTFALFVPPDGIPARTVTWMLEPSWTLVAGWTALVLAIGGGALYALAGPRRT